MQIIHTIYYIDLNLYNTHCRILKAIIKWTVLRQIQLSSTLIAISLINKMMIIIIMSHYQHGYPWPSLATLLYHPLLPAVLQGYILYQHRAAVCRFKLVVLTLLIHVNGSTGVHMSSSLLLQQCSTCLVRLTLIVFVMGNRWLYSCCFVGCCCQDLFIIAHSILV